MKQLTITLIFIFSLLKTHCQPISGSLSLSFYSDKKESIDFITKSDNSEVMISKSGKYSLKLELVIDNNKKYNYTNRLCSSNPNQKDIDVDINPTQQNYLLTVKKYSNDFWSFHTMYIKLNKLGLIQQKKTIDSIIFKPNSFYQIECNNSLFQNKNILLFNKVCTENEFNEFDLKVTSIPLHINNIREFSSAFTPLIILNKKDTVKKNKYYDYFDIKYKGDYNPNKKVSLTISHPQCPRLNLDSIHLGSELRLNLLKKEDKYYVNNGIKRLLKHKNKFVSIKFNPNNNIDSLLNLICKLHSLEIAVNYRDSISLDKYIDLNKGFGCIEDELKYTYWLKKNNGKSFSNSENFYDEIRNIKAVNYLGIPQSYYENLTNGIIINFKKGTSNEEVEKIILKYKLVKHKLYSGYLKSNSSHHFVVKTLIPDNKLMIELMKEKTVKTAIVKEVSYCIC